MRYLSLVAILALCACGGGGGGGGGSTATTTTSSSPMGVPIPATFQGPSQTQNYGLSTVTGNFFTNAFLDPQPLQQSGSGATVTLVTNERNEVTSLTLTAAGFSETFTVADPIPITNALSHGDLAFLLRNIRGGEMITGVQVLSYSAFGVWAVAPVNRAEYTATVFATGRETPAVNMPLTGSATYTGQTIGLGGTRVLQSGFSFGGNAVLNANFATGTVTTTFSGLQTQNIQSGASGTLPDITGTGSIAGNAFSSTLASNGFTGNSLGRFYGPAAQEVAGVWSAANGVAGNPSTVSLMGSFAAAR